MIDLSRKKVLVTGGAVRIGKSIAKAFAASGASVRIHCYKSKNEAEKLCASLGVPGEVFPLDFFNIDDRKLKALVSGIDILVNNAAVFPSPDGGGNEINDEKLMQINYDVPNKLMAYFVEANINGCCIVNMLDAAVLKEKASAGVYYKSKYLLYMATLSKAIEFAPGVRVNGVAPGSIIPPSWLPDSLMEKSIADMPLQKAPSVEDVAKTCIFLAENEGVTGEVIKVDGGKHLV